MTSSISSKALPPGLLDPSIIRAEKSRRHLRSFCDELYPGFIAAPHHTAIIDKLEAVERGSIRRLIIQVPPRHGKSTITSYLFPAWFLGRDPDRRVIACSYSTELAYEFSRKTRNLVTSSEYRAVFPTVGIAADARAVGQWELINPTRLDSDGRSYAHKGGYVSAGIGTGITGKGSHLMLIDDPVKNREDANSTTVLQNQWEWYTSTAYTRLEGEGAIVLIMTRWSEDDLAGRLIKSSVNEGGDRWEVLSLPALADTDDPLGRVPGQSLWPQKFDEAELDRIRVVAGSRDFTALYQQRPSPAAGTIFQREWWQRFDPTVFDRRQCSQVIQVWDTAFKAKEESDYSVCSTWAMTPRGAYVVDVFRARVEYPELKRALKDQAAKWAPDAILIEDKASGQSLTQEMMRTTQLPIIPVKADTDKVTRAHAATPTIEAGRVFLPEWAPWVAEWIEEHAAFPYGAHDDQVDTTSMAIKRLFVASGPLGNRVAVSGPRAVVSYQPR